ncbi:hypothetical protein AOQ84DRAFT_437031 [Glonium stellatum]|uniref:NB-ARC domain-containing protein n=1 Tax=Glonium stellatum TaxID=574774 RepID=A0A8E2F8C3_9PEZI|nr:hypothetical protein AOQ84DRAFT_437031 [Glonium stellatum]
MQEPSLEAQAAAAAALFTDLNSIFSQDTTPDEAALLPLLEDQYGRFNIWARNVGVFASGHASLDYRLREDPQPKALVGGLLEGLQDQLQRAIYLQQTARDSCEDEEGREEDSDAVDQSPEAYHYASSSGPVSYYSASESELASDTDTKSEILSPLQDRLRVIEQTVDKLFRFSIAIRKPSLAAQNLKADSRAIKDEEGNDISSNFELFAREFVRRRFPDAHPILQDRISKAMLLRRRRFVYRQRHQYKLENKGPSANVAKITRLWAQSQASYPTTLKAENESPHLAAILSNHKEEATVLSCTSASAFPRNRFRADSVLAPSTKASTAIYAYGNHADAVQIPPPPKLLPLSKEFECPYCCIILPVKEAAPIRWRRHVLGDLEPYVCMFDNCTQADSLFPDRTSWLSHMQWEHSRQWRCTSQEHPPRIFDKEEDFDIHMKLDHQGSFTEVQISTLKHLNAIPSPITFNTCPLCNFRPSSDLEQSDSLPQLSGFAAQQKKKKTASDELANHIAAHLQSVAVRSLPWLDDGADDASSALSASRKRRGSTISSGNEEVILEFDDEAPANTPPDESLIINTLPGDIRDEWNFLPSYEYSGHDSDPTLQAFLQALYTSDSDIHRLGGPSLPCYLIPFGRNKAFFGRTKELEAIERALCPQPSGERPEEEYALLKTFAICGPGGMGKSQLATEFVNRNKTLFDAVFYVHADEHSKLGQDFKSIAIELGLVGKDSPDSKDHVLTRERVKRWLANPVKTTRRRPSSENEDMASWLLVYDGADKSEVLNVFWPLGGSGSILITTRDPLPWTAYLNLEPFDVEDGAGFLLKMTNRGQEPGERENAMAVSQRLGGLPLALTQMARFITRRNMTFPEFLQAYSERESREEMFKFQVEESSGTGGPSNYGHTLASVWALEVLKDGKALLDVISMLDPDSISEHILTTCAERVTLKDYPQSLKTYSAARTELLQCSIVTGNARTHKLFVHRLVQDLSRLRMSPKQYRETFDNTVRLISGVWPYQPFTWRHGISRWPTCEDLFPHVIRLRELARPFTADPSNVEGDYEYARLLVDAGWYQHERGGSSEAVVYYDIAQSICESLQWTIKTISHSPISEKRVDAILAELNHNRGCIATETNCPKDALKYHSQFNSMMLKEISDGPQGNDWRLGISWNQLGTAKMINELWEEGEDCFRRSILIMQRVDNFRQVWISLPVVNLGLAYWLTNRCEKALMILGEGLFHRQAAFGMEDKESFITGRFLHALGNVKASQGAMDESLTFHRKALLHYKTTLGSNHHRTADTCIKVADHCIRLHQLDTAMALLDQALKTYGDRSVFRPEKTRAIFKRSKVLRLLRKEEEAEEALNESWKLYQEIRPADQRSAKELCDIDFDKTVVFWSR